MAEYLIQSETLDDIVDAINAKTGGSSAMTPAEMVTEIGSIQTGGATITDGIVFTAFDASGHPTAADIYGNVPTCCFGYYSNSNSVGRYMTSVRFMGGTERIGYGAFQYCGISSLNIPDSVNVIGSEFLRSSAVHFYIHENARDLYGYTAGAVGALTQCSGSIEAIQLGAIGKPLTTLYYQFMTSRAYNALTLTIYCVGANVDGFLASARRAITGGTIVFKASSETEYNGTSYAAGDTILTSEVTE